MGKWFHPTLYCTCDYLSMLEFKYISISKRGPWSSMWTVLGSRVTNYNSLLTHWGRVTYICVSKLTIIGSDNGLSPDRRQAIIWTNAGISLFGTLETNFSKISIWIKILSIKETDLKMSSGKCRPFCLGPIMLKSLLVDDHFPTRLLIGWQHSRQPIINHVKKLLFAKSSFIRESC